MLKIHRKTTEMGGIKSRTKVAGIRGKNKE
jgi:hypothetical protein